MVSLLPITPGLFIRKTIAIIAILISISGGMGAVSGARGAVTPAETPARLGASVVAAPAPNHFAWRQLTWDDFRVDDAQTGLAAETVTYLRFRYRSHVNAVTAPDGTIAYTATITRIDFAGGFNRMQSWRRSRVGSSAPNSVALLRHEQGHLDLNEIKRRQLQALPLDAFPVGRGATLGQALEDLSQRLGEWFRGEVFTQRARQTQYDEETGHGTRAKAQNAWCEQIEKEITALPMLSGEEGF